MSNGHMKLGSRQCTGKSELVSPDTRTRSGISFRSRFPRVQNCEQFVSVEPEPDIEMIVRFWNHEIFKKISDISGHMLAGMNKVSLYALFAALQKPGHTLINCGRDQHMDRIFMMNLEILFFDLNDSPKVEPLK